MKNKNAILFLLVANVFWVIIDLYRFTNIFFNDAIWNFYKENPINLVVTFSRIIVPICFIVFAVLLLKKTDNVNDLHSNDSSNGEELNSFN